MAKGEPGASVDMASQSFGGLPEGMMVNPAYVDWQQRSNVATGWTPGPQPQQFIVDPSYHAPQQTPASAPVFQRANIAPPVNNPPMPERAGLMSMSAPPSLMDNPNWQALMQQAYSGGFNG